MKTTETGFLRRLREAPIEDAIAGTALVVVVGSVLWGVFTRYLLTQPAPWSYEVATIGFAWLVFFAAAAGVRAPGGVEKAASPSPPSRRAPSRGADRRSRGRR